MAIENNNGSIIVTGEHIQVYRLLALYHALKLECKGLKMSKGLSALAAIKRTTGLTGTRATMLPKYEAWLKANNIII
jgi:hypothetical protein